ncbi:hypothetical protein [Haloarcula halophila]|uniref:hypothetical protein n=1 Tax=Haloarcula TaxID=2237 RepID=UPI0023E3763A|nr:hypothetical protein [Halomicroarcula sp. DFY41]
MSASDGSSGQDVLVFSENPVPDWVYRYGGRIRSFFRDPKAAVLGFVVTYVVDEFVTPIFNGVLATGAVLIDTVLLIAFGEDRVVGATGQLGIVDLPIWAATTLVNAFEGPAASILAVIQSYNITVGQVAAQAGIAAPAVAFVLYTVPIALFLFGAWTIIQAIDIPFVELSGLVRIVMAPINALRNFIR